jgi:ATP-dependent Lhr-like helicase
VTAGTFDRLASDIQHHVVNDLGWHTLRPVQAMTIGPVLDGEDLVVLAPTAGGKTEAAFFPLLTRMVNERWRGLSVLYLSPIRALLNNQQPRVTRYCGWVGRTAALWHGDTSATARRRIRAAPPDCLLTTPESVEGMLVSAIAEAEPLFRNVRAVVVDEVHGFAAGDRGWHLLAVLDRLQALAGHEIQRIGLSATIGNVDELRDWLCGGSGRPRRTITPMADARRPAPSVTVDHVGSLEGAAKVISRLHRGEKRLAFCDSRLQAEKLAANLREEGVETFVTHSSLSKDQREVSERAFTEGRDCVIVATSALELGIDIGDLDRVIQIDAPATVASFLQRMGRTGRRPGTASNCLFLATRDRMLVQGTAIIDLWLRGVVEPVACPALPVHLVAQQALALLLQHRSLLRSRLEAAVLRVAATLQVPLGHVSPILAHMVGEGWIGEADGYCFVGPRAERELGQKHFLDLLSVFSTPPFFTVLHGRYAIGEVHELTFRARSTDDAIVLVLGGRAWHLTHLDHRKRVAYVEPAKSGGRTRWLGSGPPVSRALAQAMRRVLLGRHDAGLHLSRRAATRLEELRDEHEWLAERGVQLVDDGDGSPQLWTFAGTAVNAALARRLNAILDFPCRADDLAITLRPGGASTAGLSTQVEGAWEQLQVDFAQAPVRDGDEVEWGAEKFVQCLPTGQREALAAAREVDPVDLRGALGERMSAMLVGG